MRTFDFKAGQRHLGKLMNEVCEQHEPVVISTEKGNEVVLVPLDDFEVYQRSWQEINRRKAAGE